MKLTVNSKETEVKDGCTVAELSTFLTLPAKGIAIAVNNLFRISSFLIFGFIAIPPCPCILSFDGSR